MKNKTFLFILITAMALMCYGAAHGQTVQKSDTVTTCKGITSKGLNCKSNWVQDNGYCRVHNPDKITCTATTTKGVACKAIVSKPGDKCAAHARIGEKK